MVYSNISMKKIHRFITPYTVENNTITVTDPTLFHQWKNVLKFKKGEEIILVDNTEGEAHCIITSYKDESVLCTIRKQIGTQKETLREVTLYMAILKKEHFEYVVQKASEIGIRKIVPLITERTIKTGLKYERLEKIAKEASELAGLSRVPEISEIHTFEEALSESLKYKTRIIFDKDGSTQHALTPDPCALFVGPEGGWTDDELHNAKESGCESFSLLSHTLRGETAGIIASYLAVTL